MFEVAISQPIPAGFNEPLAMRSPFTSAQAVAWGEMDALGHVNHAVYLRWFENCRFVYFDRLGFVAYHHQHAIGPILARIEVDYLRPVVFPDTVLISTQVSQVRNSSFRMEHVLWSCRSQVAVAKAVGVIVMVDYANDARATRVPEPLRAALRALEGVDVEVDPTC